MRVLVTGSSGFLGSRVVELLADRGHEPLACDVSEGAGDILSEFWTPPECDAVIHLAADKYAAVGEEHPARVADLNVRGTHHVVERCHGARVLLASTCKAASPHTCYGASKLIAERIVLNAGGTVLRLVNVLGSTGSVVDLWRRVPRDEPLPVTDCWRMWLEPEAAAGMLVDALELPPGRYGPAVTDGCSPAALADRLYPGRAVQKMPMRRGDRRVERITNDDERSVPWGKFVRIFDAWEEVQRCDTEVSTVTP